MLIILHGGLSAHYILGTTCKSRTSECVFRQYVNCANLSWKMLVGRGEAVKSEGTRPWDNSVKCCNVSDFTSCSKTLPSSSSDENWHKHYTPEMTYPRGHKTRCVYRCFEVNLEAENKMVYESLNTSGKRGRKEFEWLFFSTLRYKAFFPFPHASLSNSLRKGLNLRLKLKLNFSDPLPSSAPMRTCEPPLLGLETQVGHVHLQLKPDGTGTNKE